MSYLILFPIARFTISYINFPLKFYLKSYRASLGWYSDVTGRSLASEAPFSIVANLTRCAVVHALAALVHVDAVHQEVPEA